MENILIKPLSAGLPVDIIDSIVITQEKDITKILAEWSALDSNISIYSNLTSLQAVKLFINWSDHGTIDLQQGDYFTFVIPEIFDYIYVTNVTDVDIVNEFDEIVATYSIYDNNNVKEIKIVFTDYVDTHTSISGNLWLLLFVGKVTATEQKNLEFIINGNLEAEGGITVSPKGNLTPRNNKVGFSLPARIVDGYYIFEWLVYFNMTENTVNGFNTIKDFSFEDILPIDSPHIFLTDAIRQELGILPTDYQTQIGEYIGADSYTPENRYPTFLYHYNSTDNNIWYNSIHWETLTNGYTSTGIDGNGGLNVANISIEDKSFSANLGTVTRPTAMRFFTISTAKLKESALGDSEVVKLFKNAFNGSSTEELNAALTLYRFQSGGSAQGIVGDYSFSFTKVNETGSALKGALFSLFTSENFDGGADRLARSGNNGVVLFANLPVGTYYIKETETPYGYIPNDTTYKVELTSQGYEIFYGDSYENKLDANNEILNQTEFDVKTVSVVPEARKTLVGRTLASGMFRFVVKDSNGTTVATGTNDASGNIIFSKIDFNAPGIYTFTIEELKGSYSGVTYDGSKFSVTVTVTDLGSGNLAAGISYFGGGIIFNNGYSVPPVGPCPCFDTKCRKSIKGQKVWVDNENARNTRPDFIEITLLQDGEVYRRLSIDSKSDGKFAFCCLPIWKNSSQKYVYQIDEETVPDGYTKTIEKYKVTNTLTP